MNARRISALLCLGLIAVAPRLSAAEDTTCPALLAPMQATMAAARAGLPRSALQEEQWRDWNISCRAPAWQRQLAALGPPIAPQTVYHFPPAASQPANDVPAPVALTWRDYARAAFLGFGQGLEQGMTGTITTYSNVYRVPGHTYRSQTTCVSSVYGASCNTSTR